MLVECIGDLHQPIMIGTTKPQYSLPVVHPSRCQGLFPDLLRGGLCPAFGQMRPIPYSTAPQYHLHQDIESLSANAGSPNLAGNAEQLHIVADLSSRWARTSGFSRRRIRGRLLHTGLVSRRRSVVKHNVD